MDGRMAVLFRATKDGALVPALVLRAVDAVPQIGGRPIEGADVETLLDLVYVDPAKADSKSTSVDSHTAVALGVRPAVNEPGAPGYATVHSAFVDKDRFCMSAEQAAEYDARAREAEAALQQRLAAIDQQARVAGSVSGLAGMAGGATLPSAADLDAMAAEKAAAEATAGGTSGPAEVSSDAAEEATAEASEEAAPADRGEDQVSTD